MREESERFRHVMGHFATGVSVVSGVDGTGRPVGLTANSVASVSLEPRLVLVCMDLGSSTLGAIEATGAFAISILRAGRSELALRFAREAPGERFRGIPLRENDSGLPILDEALAWIACTLWRSVDAGDHRILIGEVTECGAAEGAPLIFHRGDYGTFAP